MCTQCNSYKSEFTYEMSSLILLQITDLNEKIKAETDSATKYKKSCAELQQVSLVYIKPQDNGYLSTTRITFLLL